MTKIILFNGPARSGKDTASDYVSTVLENNKQYKMAMPLKYGCHALFSIMNTNLAALEHLKTELISYPLTDEFTESNQNLNCPLVIEERIDGFHIDHRQFYIHISENVLKPLFGNEIFGHLAVRAIRSMRDPEYVLISDCGFVEEINPIIRSFGAENVILVRLTRKGFTFSGDSRGYIDLPGVRTFEVGNNGTLEELYAKLDKVLSLTI